MLSSRTNIPTQDISKISSIINSIGIEEKDSFILTSYILENIYPGDYFFSQEVKTTQYLKVIEFGKTLRPKIQKSLSILFVDKESNQASNLTAAYTMSMQILAKECYDSLFSFIPLADLYRVCDCLLIFGFEFLHKFLIAYLSKYEKSIIQCISKSSKSFQIAPTKETLFLSGIASFSQLISGKYQGGIEALIKKSIRKPSYSRAEIDISLLESDASLMISNRILAAKDRFKLYEYGFIQDLILKIKAVSLENSVNSVQLQKVFEKYDIAKENQVVVLALLTNQLSDCFPLLRVVCLIAVLSNSDLESKLKLIFNMHSRNNSDVLQMNEGVKVLLCLDSFTPTQNLNNFKVSLVEDITYRDLADVICETKEYFEIVDLLDAKGRKSKSGSYIKSESWASLEEKEETSDASPEYFSESEEDCIEKLPESSETNSDDKSNKRKCTRLCTQSCIIV